MANKRPSALRSRAQHDFIGRVIKGRLMEPPPERKYATGDYVRIIATGVVAQVTAVTSYGFYRLAGQTNEFPASALEPADPP